MIIQATLMLSNDISSSPPPGRLAICPSCGCKSLFTYAGITHWPERVARKVGVDPDVRLWNCTGCDTTLCEQELDFGCAPK